MLEEIKIYHVNGKYRIVFEKAAGVKTGDGFKVEVNGDYLTEVMTEACALYGYATEQTKPPETIEGKE